MADFLNPRPKTIPELIERRSIPEPNSGCWIWEGPAWSGRGGRFYGCASFQGRDRLAHRVSFEAFKGPITDGLFVCHRCDNTLCVNPDHLFLGTNRDNMQDMVRKGRHVSVVIYALTPQQRASLSGECFRRTINALAAEYGVSPSTIARFRRSMRAAKAA